MQPSANSEWQISSGVSQVCRNNHGKIIVGYLKACLSRFALKSQNCSTLPFIPFKVKMNPIITIAFVRGSDQRVSR